MRIYTSTIWKGRPKYGITTILWQAYHTSCNNNMKQKPNKNIRISGSENVLMDVTKFRDNVSYMYNSDCYCYNELTQVLPGLRRASKFRGPLRENAEQCHVFGTKIGTEFVEEFCTRVLPKSRVTICEKRRRLTLNTCQKWQANLLYR